MAYLMVDNGLGRSTTLPFVVIVDCVGVVAKSRTPSTSTRVVVMLEKNVRWDRLVRVYFAEFYAGFPAEAVPLIKARTNQEGIARAELPV